jgi:hypothetical protein
MLCPFRGCKSERPAHAVCCKAHWISMTGQQRSAIYDAIEDRQHGESSDETLQKRIRRVIDAAQSEGVEA